MTHNAKFERAFGTFVGHVCTPDIHARRPDTHVRMFAAHVLTLKVENENNLLDPTT